MGGLFQRVRANFFELSVLLREAPSATIPGFRV